PSSCLTRRTSTSPCSTSGSARPPVPLRRGPRARSQPRSVEKVLPGFLVAWLGGQGRDEGLLRHVDAPDGLHPLLALLLLLQQLALARDVAAVALGQHVLAHRADVLAGDDTRADRGLDRDLELLARDQLLELGRHGQAVLAGVVGVDDLAER